MTLKLVTVNRISLALNVVLTIAVAVLFYLHFSNKPQTISTADSNKQKTDSLARSIPTTREQTDAKIVYLNIDTLQKKYEYFADVKKKYDTQLRNLESMIENEGVSFQNDYNTYVQVGATLPLDKQQSTEADLKKRKEHIEELQNNKDAVENNADRKSVV